MLLPVLMAVAEQLGHNSFFVVIKCNLLPYGSGICHYICMYIIFSHLKNSLCPFLLLFFLKRFSFILIKQRDWSMLQTYHSHVCFLSKGGNGLFHNLCLMFVFVCFGLDFYMD